ncbi:MAG: hypothetical protein GXP17_07885 [Gammaproteobacteria bacterium]|nr:hypothetical protein [Gammaproteobacteria bacterium]
MEGRQPGYEPRLPAFFLEAIKLLVCVFMRANQIIFGFIVFVLSGASVYGADADRPKVEDGGLPEKPLGYIAIVDGEHLPISDYIAVLRRGLRDRFYHGKAPQEELKAYRKEVAEQMVERYLLVREAKRRKIKYDETKIELELKEFDAKFVENKDWEKARDAVLKGLQAKLQGDSRAERLEKEVRRVADPSEEDLRTFYTDFPELFTMPERNRIQFILLRVDPSSSSTVWQQASDEAAEIVRRLEDGADFAELARIHSSDQSAADGGDVGFIHSGMLGSNAQQVLDLMEPGELSAPVILLEGVGVFRLLERAKPTLSAFEDVHDRALRLYRRETGEKLWVDLVKDLHEQAAITFNDAPWR